MLLICPAGLCLKYIFLEFCLYYYVAEWSKSPLLFDCLGFEIFDDVKFLNCFSWFKVGVDLFLARFWWDCYLLYSLRTVLSNVESTLGLCFVFGAFNGT
jgi:hypothetical protein